LPGIPILSITVDCRAAIPGHLTLPRLDPEDLAALRAACAPGYAADEALHAQHSGV